jgi:hypothetical protein
MFFLDVLALYENILKKKKFIYNNNNNNNLFLRSRPSHKSNWCMKFPCLWDKRPPLRNDFTAKVYEGIHTLTHSGFELVTSKEETHALNHLGE